MRSETLAKISSAAARVFAEFGYHGATMKRIAESAGQSYGLVYHYFQSKEAVFRHLVDFALEGTIAGMRAVLGAPGTAWERLERYSAMLVESALAGDSSLYFLVMIQAQTQAKSIEGLQRHIKNRTVEYYDALVPLVLEAQAAGEAARGDPEVLVAAYLSLVQGLALLVYQGRGLEKKITADILMSVLRA
jgi:AcrR family transcriptional regulator